MTSRALLLGINNYKAISDLRGCLNDVKNVRSLLVQDCGFPEGNIVALTDADVVKSRVLEEFRRLAADSESGDRLVLHFSGHGSYTPSEDADEDVDELLCLYDMDWGDPETYLVDDDLGELLKTVADGVRLSVILDCCHSGTGTRVVTPRGARVSKKPGPKNPLVIIRDTASLLGDGQSGAAVRSFLRGEAAPENPVLARFALPPADYQVSEFTRHRARSLGRSARELNHQLFSAARDDQTAADAHIEGSFNGAFSFYFCQAIRDAGSQASASSVFEATRQAISDNGYSQIPQLEGPFSDEAVLGGASDGAPNRPHHSGTGSDAGGSQGVPPGGEQFWDFLAGFVSQLPGFWSQYRADSSGDGSTGRGEEEAWVTVHGISRHTAGYSNRWWRSMQPFITKRLSRTEVLWSQHVNPRSLPRAEEAELEQYRAAIEAVLEERLAADLGQSGARQPAALERGDGFSLDDFLLYMMNGATRDKILGEFTTAVEPLLRAGKKLHIVSHSWGTVVAYEGLRRLESRRLSGEVRNLFVVGSALSLGPVRSNLFGRVNDGRKPSMVRHFINLDAKGDFVGGRLRPHFDIDEPEFLNLEAVGCRKVWPFPPPLGCAHSSYFDPSNIATNRDIFARFINAGAREVTGGLVDKGGSKARADEVRVRVSQIVRTVITVMNGGGSISEATSFGFEGIGWDGPKKRGAFVPIDNLLGDDGYQIVGIGPDRFEGLNTVGEMVAMVRANLARV